MAYFLVSDAQAKYCWQESSCTGCLGGEDFFKRLIWTFFEWDLGQNNSCLAVWNRTQRRETLAERWETCAITRRETGCFFEC